RSDANEDVTRTQIRYGQVNVDERVSPVDGSGTIKTDRLHGDAPERIDPRRQPAPAGTRGIEVASHVRFDKRIVQILSSRTSTGLGARATMAFYRHVGRSSDPSQKDNLQRLPEQCIELCCERLKRGACAMSVERSSIRPALEHDDPSWIVSVHVHGILAAAPFTQNLRDDGLQCCRQSSFSPRLCDQRCN
ncbi:hypothetical protein OY671_007844, partial [Metschnikowia pulcherrima]